MWEVAQKAAAKREKVERDMPERSVNKAPVQEKEIAEGPELSYESMRVHYSSPSNQGVIQRKQTTPLAERLRAQGIDVDSLGSEISNLIRLYDALENTASTKESQQRYLHLLINALYYNLNELYSNLESKKDIVNIRTVLQIAGDELRFVSEQSFNAPFTAPPEAWTHMNDSPFLRMAAEIAHKELRITPKPGSPAGRVPSEPRTPQDTFSSYDMIRAMSQHHIRQLIRPDRPPAPTQGFWASLKGLFSSPVKQPGPLDDPQTGEFFFQIYLKVIETLLREGMLSHYSHKPDLTVLHSTNYLKANHMLAREGVAKRARVKETENVSKSMSVDTEMFRNTGFVFFFLERNGSAHHRATGFGKYRYTVRLTDNPAILNNAWAMLHDMAGSSSHSRSIRRDSPVRRIIISSFQPEDIATWEQLFSEHSSQLLNPDANLRPMLSLFLPTANQQVFLQTPDAESHDTEIVDHISGNFLQGSNILQGIALRLARELMALYQYSRKEYNTIMSSDDTLWEYILNAVHDMQIMVPQDVLPTQCDFEEAGTIHPIDIAASSTPRHIRAQDSAKAQSLLSGRNVPGMNNCFFEAMFPLMGQDLPGVQTAQALRQEFVHRQGARGLVPLPDGQPVEYHHVQQFTTIFNVAITVIVMDQDRTPIFIDFEPQGANPQSHYYIRFLPAASENGIGHYTNLYSPPALSEADESAEPHKETH